MVSADKLVMKVVVILFLFMIVSSGFNPAIAATEKDCEGINHPGYKDEYRACLRTNIAIAATEAGVDCIDCLFQQEGTGSNSWVQGLGAIAQPLAYFAGMYSLAKFQNKTQEAWANAYASGHAECTNRFNSYINYNTTIGANPISASDAMGMSSQCNGQGYGGYAGYGGMTNNGYGGYGNPFQANGFSPGFMNGMGGMNPYGNYSLYNNGMGSAGVGISAWGSASVNTGVTTAFGF